jgi:uncharacterized protein (DUF1330 family)
MTVSAIVHTKFVDQGLKAELLGAFPQFKGALALAGEHSEVIEGETDVDKTVLASFPGLAAFTAWVESSDYTNAFLSGDCRPAIQTCSCATRLTTRSLQSV